MGSFDLVTLGVALAALLGVLFVADYFWVKERTVGDAAKRTSNRFLGVSIGLAGAAVMLVVDMIHLVADLPGVVIGMVGLGQVIGWFNLTAPEFAGVFAFTYIFAAGVAQRRED